MLTLRGVGYGNIMGASGVQGWFGEGYWFHRYYRPFGLDFGGMTFVAKTATAFHNKGNMPFNRTTFKPKELFPECIVIDRKNEVILNAVGLSCPGVGALLHKGDWQRRTAPFMLSVMAIGKESAEQRMLEIKCIRSEIEAHRYGFKVPFALQVNGSCPNVGLDPSKLVGETRQTLDILASLGVPLVPKFNVLIPVDAAREIALHPACDAVHVSNTLPWKDVPNEWKVRFFGSETSPLERFGGGGLSGAPLFPLVSDWLAAAMAAGFPKPIIAGGGILHGWQATELLDRGAAAVAIGSVASIAPRRVKGIIAAANRCSE